MTHDPSTPPRVPETEARSPDEQRAPLHPPRAEFPLGEIADRDLRAALHRVADHIADYLDGGVREHPVLPRIEPGAVARRLPDAPPETPESLERILDDYERLIEPHVTHWNHPGFMAYFGITGSGPGVLGEALAAMLNVNAMLWRTSPAATELEVRCCDWLRQMLGLPEGLSGHINDTASTSSLVALTAAREALGLEVRQLGLAGREDLPPLTVYLSDQAHSSIDKAALVLGLGLENIRRLPSDKHFRLRPEALAEALAEDRAAGRRPLAVVATAGTTSTTSVDPLEAMADLCEEHDVWFHVDAAYAGSAAACEEYRELLAGWERADSLVFNPHKWLFVPIDCSVLFVQDPNQLKAAFSLVPEYLKTAETQAPHLMDLGFQLGRRFRALKLWFVLRAFGLDGIRANIREHCRLARRLAERVEAHEGFELAAPAPFSTVCLRARFPDASPEEEDQLNEALLDAVNAHGPVFLSHTKLPLGPEGGERYVLRVAIGNLKTTEADVDRLWDILTREALDLTRRVPTETGEESR